MDSASVPNWMAHTHALHISVGRRPVYLPPLVNLRCSSHVCMRCVHRLSVCAVAGATIFGNLCAVYFNPSMVYTQNT